MYNIISCRVVVDFGNSLPITRTGSMNSTVLDTLAVAIDVSDKPNLNCSDELSWLGVVFNKILPDWFEISAGIQVFPTMGSLSEEQRSLIKDHPLVVIEVCGTIVSP